MNQVTNRTEEAVEPTTVRPLADLIGIDFEGMSHLSVRLEQIDEAMEKRLKKISCVTENAEGQILDGIEVMGNLMWWAGNNPEVEKMGSELDHELLNSGGYFIKALAGMLRERKG